MQAFAFVLNSFDPPPGLPESEDTEVLVVDPAPAVVVVLVVVVTARISWFALIARALILALDHIIGSCCFCEHGAEG
jgi:hypothetical protein